MPNVVQFAGPRKVALISEPEVVLSAGTVRVRTRYSGISAGTELTAYRGTNPYLTHVWDPHRRLFVEGSSTQSYPVAGWGYSEVGEVVEIDPALVGQPGVPSVGDWVWGIWGHRSEAVLPVERLIDHVLPAGVDPLAASFTRVGAVALNAVLAADIHLGELVAVFGQGVIGLLATRLATLSGAAVVAVDAVVPRLKKALEFGAIGTLNPADGSVAEGVRAFHGGRGADTAIELSGAYPALHQAIRSVSPGGRVVAAGFYQGDGLHLRLGEEFHHNRVELVCSQIGGVPRALSERWDANRLNSTFLQLVAVGRIDPVALVSHRVPAHEVAAAFEMLDQRPADALQVVLDFTEE